MSQKVDNPHDQQLFRDLVDDLDMTKAERVQCELCAEEEGIILKIPVRETSLSDSCYYTICEVCFHALKEKYIEQLNDNSRWNYKYGE